MATLMEYALDGQDDVTSESFSRVSEFVGAIDGAEDPFRGLLEKQIITKPGKCPTDRKSLMTGGSEWKTS